MRYETYETAHRFAQEYQTLYDEALAKRQEIASRADGIFEPVRKYESLKDVEEHLEEGHFEIEISGWQFSALFQNRPGKKLYVMLSDGTPRDRTPEGIPLPLYKRWTYAALLDGPLLNIEDPMYRRYPDIVGGYFYGTGDHCIVDETLDLIRSVCRHLSFSTQDVVFYASSSGAYASILAASRLPGSLVVAIMPRFILSQSPWGKNLSEVIGIDPQAPDPFHRTDLAPLIQQSPLTRYVILYNIDSYDDTEKQELYFADEMGMSLKYGLSRKDNVLMWGYSSPDGHSGQETRELAPYILSISRKFAEGRLTEEDERDVLSFNQLWRWVKDTMHHEQDLQRDLDAERKAHQEAVDRAAAASQQATQQHKEGLQSVWKKFLRLAMEGASFLRDRRFLEETIVSVPFRYAVLRTLEACHPQRVLEFGFDEVTRIVCQYAEASACSHEVYDWDRERVVQSLQSWPFRIHHTEIRGSGPVQVQRQGQSAIIYPAFSQRMKDHPEVRFDCILLKRSIVRGGGTPSMDAMPYLPKLLEKDFIVIVDDAEEACECMMMEDAEKLLAEQRISYRIFSLSDGFRTVRMMVSERWAQALEDRL